VPAELIEAGNIPFAALDDTQDLNGPHRSGHAPSAKRGGTVLDGRHDALNKVIIAELAIRTSLELVKRSLKRILGQPALKLGEACKQILHADLFRGLAKQAPIKLLDPVVILSEMQLCQR